VIKAADGQDLEVDLGGFRFYPVQLSDAQLTDLERARSSPATAQTGTG
jgi:hypothetical protein